MDKSSQPMDLLSAALCVSGVSEELEEYDSSGFDLAAAYGTPVRPVLTQPQRFISTAIPQHTRLQYVQNPATFIPSAHAQYRHPTAPMRFVQSTGGFRVVQPGGMLQPYAMRAPTATNAIRRVIIRTPQGQQVGQFAERTVQSRARLPTTPIRPPAHQQPVVSRIMNLTPGRSSPIPSHSPQIINNPNTGPLRIIKIGKQDSTQSLPTSAPAPKILKLVKASSAPISASSGTVKRILVQGPNQTGVQSTAGLCSVNITAPQVNHLSNPLALIRQAGDSVTRAPSPKTVVTASSGGIKDANVVHVRNSVDVKRSVSVASLPIQSVKTVAPQVMKVVGGPTVKNYILKKSNEDTTDVSYRLKSSVRTYSKQSPMRTTTGVSATTGNVAASTANIAATNASSGNIAATNESTVTTVSNVPSNGNVLLANVHTTTVAGNVASGSGTISTPTHTLTTTSSAVSFVGYSNVSLTTARIGAIPTNTVVTPSREVSNGSTVTMSLPNAQLTTNITSTSSTNQKSSHTTTHAPVLANNIPSTGLSDYVAPIELFNPIQPSPAIKVMKDKTIKAGFPAAVEVGKSRGDSVLVAIEAVKNNVDRFAPAPNTEKGSGLIKPDSQSTNLNPIDVEVAMDFSTVESTKLEQTDVLSSIESTSVNHENVFKVGSVTDIEYELQQMLAQTECSSSTNDILSIKSESVLKSEPLVLDSKCDIDEKVIKSEMFDTKDHSGCMTGIIKPEPPDKDCSYKSRPASSVLKPESDLQCSKDGYESTVIKPETNFTGVKKDVGFVKQVFPESQQDSKATGVKTESCTSLVVEKSENVIKVETISAVKSESPVAVKSGTKRAAKSGNNSDKHVASESTGEQEDSNSFGGFGDLAGGDFFQALAQLQDTNKKAKVFEEKVKAKNDHIDSVTTSQSIKTTVSTTPSNNTTIGASKTNTPPLDEDTASADSTSNSGIITTTSFDSAAISNQNFGFKPTVFTQPVNSQHQRFRIASTPNVVNSPMTAFGLSGAKSRLQSFTPPISQFARVNQTVPRMSSSTVLTPITSSPRFAMASPMDDDDFSLRHTPRVQPINTDFNPRLLSPFPLKTTATMVQQNVAPSTVVAQHGHAGPPYTVHRSDIHEPMMSRRSRSPLTLIQRVNSPGPASPIIRVVSTTQQSLTPSARYIAVSRNAMQTQSSSAPRIEVITRPMGNGHITAPIRSVHSMPRILHNDPSSMMVNSRPSMSGTRVVMGPDGTQRVVAISEKPRPIQLTDKDVSRMWVNEDIKLRSIQSEPNFIRSGSPGLSMFGGAQPVEEEVEEEEEELGIAETYSDYMPSKSKVGLRHPDTVVETSSLSSVESPDVHYKLNIPEHVIDYGHLSALQLETMIYACQKHKTFLPSGQRAGFLVGDGAGVGKGRTIAGLIYENYLDGRKRSLWLSVSNDLRVDAERDLRDIGANKIEVHPLNKFKYAKITSSINNKVKKGVVFSTYSALIGESSAGGKYRTRFKQLMHWLGKDFDGLIVFDECHRAKNLCPVGSAKPTKTGLTVLELQNKLPKARIIYASATGASEPRNMAYMTRLGLWGAGTPFPQFTDFIQAVEKRGVGAMELVAMDMKLRGTYIARQLSFHGVQFKIETVPIDEKLQRIYNESVQLWVEARDKFCKAVDLMGAENRSCKTMWGQFWSAHQRFFKYLCISAKVNHCVKIARDAIKSGKCVVIGLQSTGEARTQEALEEYGEISDFVSTAKGVFQSMVERHFPAPNKQKTFDLLSLFDDEVPSSLHRGQKRKKTFAEMCDVKRRKEDWSSDDSGNDSDTQAVNNTNKKSHKSNNKHSKKRDAPSSGAESSEEDGSGESASSDSAESEESEADNFNPFGAGSDSDDDPWVKRTKAKKAKKNEKKKKKKEKKKQENGKIKKKKKNSKRDESDDDEDFDSKFDKVLMASGLKSNPDNPGSMPALSVGPDDADKACELRRDLLVKIERLGEKLPPNTLDQLIDDLGGPENVAEMTGRKGRIVSDEDGSIRYESRSESDIPLEILNLAEKQRFMDGEKFIAVISEAASSGISLQADRRANNQRRRVHITLELPWSADRAIQQFGRTHRSNQVSAPQYIFLISNLAGERRFASTVSKRLESLGALTHGDRRATETRDLSQFNIDNKYGRTALEAVMRSIAQGEASLVPPPSNYSGRFYDDARTAMIGVGMVHYSEKWSGFPTLDKDYNNISRFLNRLLGTEVELQNALFQYFTDTLAAVCLQAKRNGRWDMGILDLGSSGEQVKLLATKKFVGSFSGTSTKVEIHTISVERGMTYNEAMRVWHEHSAEDDGFYLSTTEKNGRRGVILAVMLQGKRNKTQQLYNVYKPNSGLQNRPESLRSIKTKYRKALPDAARHFWEDQHAASATMCSHAYWKGACRKAGMNLCETGLRSRTYYVLSGSVLSVWHTVESVLMSTPGSYATRMQVIRLRTDEGKRIVGTLIPSNALASLEVMLSQETRIYNTQHATSAQEGDMAASGLLGNRYNALQNNQNSILHNPHNLPSNRTSLLSNQMTTLGNQNSLLGNQNSQFSSHLNNLSSLLVSNNVGSQGSLVTSASSGNLGYTNQSVIEGKQNQQYLNMPTFF